MLFMESPKQVVHQAARRVIKASNKHDDNASLNCQPSTDPGRCAPGVAGDSVHLPKKQPDLDRPDDEFAECRCPDDPRIIFYRNFPIGS